MQFGSRVRLLVVLSAVAALWGAMSGQPSMAQFLDQDSGYGSPAQRRSPPWGAAQALFTPGRWKLGAEQTPYVDANGKPVVVPAGYLEQCPGGCPGACAGPAPCGPGCGPGAPCDGYCGGPDYGGFTGPYPMGAGGTDPAVGYDLMEDVGVAGFLVDQRGPHYWDVRAEAVWLEADNSFRQHVDFTSLNQGNTIVLSTSQFDYEFETGFRVFGRYDICPLAVLEFGYMGIYDFETRADAFDTGFDLFSLFSRPNPGEGNFGTDPAGVAVVGGPMPQSERAFHHSISLDMQLQSAEMSYRRYWVGFIPRISGTLLAGFRYAKLKEDFLFHADSPVRLEPGGSDPAATFDYAVRTDNDLAGFQAGGDVWVGLMQGVRIGAEGKAGIYNNHYTIRNIITATPSDRPFSDPVPGDRFDDNEAAFIGEASADVVADLLPSVSFRAGYEILYLNSVLRAGDNFNPVSPYGNQDVPRVEFVAEQGSAFFHGWHAGIEYIW